MKKYSIFFPTLIIAFFTVFSCTKTKTEFIEVEVDKKYSWKEVTRFTGYDRFLTSSGGNADALYFQQPYGFSEVKGTADSKIKIYGGLDLALEIITRIPISPNFSAYSMRDTLLILFNNKRPNESAGNVQINLKSIDPTLMSIKNKNYNTYRSKCMDINKNGTLILSYFNKRATEPYTLMLVNMKTSDNFPFIQTIFTKQVTIPRLTTLYSEVNAIVAIDDYFIVNCGYDGVYKVKEDGTFRKIIDYGAISVIYKYQNNVYLYDFRDKVFISSDNSENWQEYNISSEFPIRGKYSIIKDSLVAMRQGNIFTLKWNGTNYTQRFLKNDGFETADINGIEILKDTVYVATTSGLYVKPVSMFFDTKK